MRARDQKAASNSRSLRARGKSRITSSKPRLVISHALRNSAISYSSLIRRISERRVAKSASASPCGIAAVDRAIVAAHDVDGMIALVQIVKIRGNLLQRAAAVDAEEELAFVEAHVAPDPELAVDAIGEKLGFAAIVRRREEQRAVRGAVRFEHQQRAGFAGSHQIREIARAAKAKIRVVRTHVFLSGRDDEIRARKRARERVSPRARSRASCGCAPARSGVSSHPLDMKSTKRCGVSPSCLALEGVDCVRSSDIHEASISYAPNPGNFSAISRSPGRTTIV